MPVSLVVYVCVCVCDATLWKEEGGSEWEERAEKAATCGICEPKNLKKMKER